MTGFCEDASPLPGALPKQDRHEVLDVVRGLLPACSLLAHHLCISIKVI